MKNFKKVLALVLAIATLLSFATVASAATADFKDAADIKYTEAVDVLSAIKVLEGYPADNTYKPAKNITREEAAKIIAIFANKSADISSLYTSANPFADEKGRWGESYVAYGYRAGIIAGKSATQFKPTANVKGTEFLKMVLVVLGYDQNKEGLVGSSWAVNTLELAKAKSLMAGLPSTWDANAALTRDEAAQIMLNALKAETVVYGQTVTNLVYNTATKTWGVTNATSAAAVYVSPNGAQNNYNHTLLAAGFGLTLTASQDAWGRPTHTWKKGAAATTIGEYVDSDKLLATFKTAVSECDIAKAAGIAKEKTYDLYVNGVENKFSTLIEATDLVNKLGAQGRLTEVYTDRIVMIDTFLAKVTGVTEAKKDAAGHLIAPATLTMVVYDDANGHPFMTTSTTNFPYVAGDYVLVNAKTATLITVADNRNNSGLVSYKPRTTTNEILYAEIAGKATSIEGAQSVIWYNAGKHTVEGTTYDDALKFLLGNDQMTSTAKRTWFMDSYGNLIGSTSIATVYSYGIVTSIWWVNDGTNGSGKAMATVRYMDDTTNTVTVSSVDILTAASTAATTGATKAYIPAYSDNQTNLNMTFVESAIADAAGKLYVSTNADANAAAQIKTLNKDIVVGHLFKLNTLADGTVALAEVSENTSAADKTQVHSEVTNASILNKYSVITGDNSKTIYVDATTKFLIATQVNGVYTYTYKTGLNEMPSFKAGAKVDYVNGADGAADYVYIIGEPTDATTRNFVLITGQAYSAVLKDNGGVKYYEITLPIPAEDGSVATIKVLDNAAGRALLTKLTANTNTGKLFYVTYTNGFATDAVEITSVGQQYDAVNAPKARASKLTDATMPYGVEGGVVLGGGARFNVTNATKVIGDLSVNMTDKLVYVLVDDAADNNVSKIYVIDLLHGGNHNTNTDDWKLAADGSYAYNATLGQVVVKSNNLTVGQLTSGLTAAGVTGITGVTGTYYTTNPTTGIRTLQNYTGADGDTLASVLALDSAALILAGANWTITK